MSTFLTALEFAQHLRLDGCEWAEEIIEALENYEPALGDLNTLREELDYRAPAELKGEHTKIIEHYQDRSDVLGEIEEMLTDEGLIGELTDANGRVRKVEADDAVRELIERLTPEQEYDL